MFKIMMQNNKKYLNQPKIFRNDTREIEQTSKDFDIFFIAVQNLKRSCYF